MRLSSKLNPSRARWVTGTAMRAIMKPRCPDTLRCMPDWQERITRDSGPSLRVEHELRYGLAAPLIRGAALWCDLGCGNGVAAARITETEPPQHALLVDVDPVALETASRELAGLEPQTLHADLATPEGVEQARAALLAAAHDGTRTITC